MTACLPSFSRMLHHHLPAWKSSQSRLLLYKLTNFFSSGAGSFRHSEKSQLEMKSPRKTSRLPIQHRSIGDTQQHDSSMGPYLNLDSMPEPTHRDDLELGPMGRVQTVIGGGRERVVEEDGIFLKQDLSQGWSSVNTH